ncbi:hypothetical protein D0862_00826 [Hortaea werneckii]|uniref:U4/U6 snRNA-associated-splicing factor PRP24 n=1 Tax=Hortaea werneckii TaxID=91943 RepID=A0A3M7HVZ0_HORWE|nr:hypothetical protein D0862_00826 [Hortaea werneckii]
MNINALLSPENSPAPEGNPPPTSNGTSSPKKGAGSRRPPGGKRTSSGLSQEVKRSPDRVTSSYTNPTPDSSNGTLAGGAQQTFPLNSAAESAPGFRPLQQAAPPTSLPTMPLSSQDPLYGSSAPSFSQQLPDHRANGAHRPSSTPHMETLASESSEARLPLGATHASAYTTSNADLALMHHASAQRTASIESIPPANAARASAQLYQTRDQAPPMPRTGSGGSIKDLLMAGPAQTPPPRAFPASSALTEAESQTINELLNYLNEHSYAYDSHLQLIGLLHKGLISHTYPPTGAPDIAPRDPHSYAQLNELRQSRNAMDSRFAVGEALWIEWLADETLLARTAEERISVTELYQKAVGDEPASVKLWQLYADWVESNYRACNDLEGSDASAWSVEDKEMCRELFTFDMLVNVLEQGIAATQWRIDESHLLWNRWMTLLVEALPNQPSQMEIERIRNAFFERLQTPHTTSRQTQQDLLWPFINKFYPQDWEVVMDHGNEIAEPSRKQVALREEHELSVLRAIEAGDREASFNALSNYISYEKKHKNRGVFTYELSCGLYERALLLFPTSTDWWLDYIDVVLSATGSSSSTSVLPLMERATRHCPWSGELWAKRILRSDVEGRPHDDIEQTKHMATNSGLMDVGGMEELLKVLQQWCSYLRREAFSPTASEDDADIAEVGIRSALENIEKEGQNVYGKEFRGDPLYRLETILIKFLSQARRLNDAREIWQRLSSRHAHEAAFWEKYHNWELYLWGYERMSEKHRVESKENAPHLASAVVRQALSQNVAHLDWPEKVGELFLNHFQLHESSDELQAALIEAREFSKRVAVRRAKEAEVAAAQAAEAAAERGQQDLAYAAEAEAEAAGVAVPGSGGKRKADESSHLSGGGAMSKKAKTGEYPAAAAGPNEPSSSATAQIKRDREHNTVTVRNLPNNVEELEVKKFFRDIGQPASINIVQDKGSDTASATVEFELQEDVLAAKTRNGREIRPGYEVRIQSGSQNTLYVANYPPEYDEQAIRKLFDSYGEVISVRFPSLKFNNRRRFCYVQFLTEDMARQAEETMDSKTLDGQHKLIAKISNPEAKKQRSGAQAEGREIFVKNLERDASDQEIKEYFSEYGTVVSMNLLKLVNNKKTGTGFVVFASADEANKALAADGKPFHDRILHVEISAAKAEGRTAPLDRARKTDVIVKQSTPDASLEIGTTNGRRGSDVSMHSASLEQQEAFRTARERKIAIMKLPDTVNDARIRAVMESYGPIVKIQLRRQEEGAIVEFQTVKDAFNVRQGVDVSSLGPEAKTGDVADLLGKKKGGAGFGGGMRPAPVSRPGQGRGGRRGGLGFKRGGFGGTSRSENIGSGGANASAGGRSNADFRAMFEAGRTAEGKPSSGDD